MSEVIGLLVTRNEEDRYLQSVLEHNRPLLDRLLVFDDLSTDRTQEIAMEYGTLVERPFEVPSFSEHEGRFRAAAWRALALEMSPEYGDVIVAFDADEYLIGDCSKFEGRAARVPVDECWEVQDDIPRVRTDGAWGKIYDIRTWHWQLGLDGEAETHLLKGRVGRNKKNADYGKVASGCGPYQNDTEWHSDLRILHVGYLDPEDRLVKQQRYRNDGRHGSRHVQSITERPSLRKLARGVAIRRGSTVVEGGC